MASRNGDREFDVIVFGASGFTGQYVVEYLRGKPKLRVGIAGRSAERLARLGRPENIIIADVNNESAMRDMCRRGTVLLNCVGPYRFFGEAVVRACLAADTHYLDISGEPEFIESMELQYKEEAQKKVRSTHLEAECPGRSLTTRWIAIIS